MLLLDSGAEICQIFRWVIGKFKNQKGILKLSDIYQITALLRLKSVIRIVKIL